MYSKLIFNLSIIGIGVNCWTKTSQKITLGQNPQNCSKQHAYSRVYLQF